MVFGIIIMSTRRVYESGFAKWKTKEQRTASLDLMMFNEISQGDFK